MAGAKKGILQQSPVVSYFVEKVKAQCSGAKGSGKGDRAHVLATSDAKCSVTAYLEDGRVTAMVMDVEEGTYSCFEGGEARCER